MSRFELITLTTLWIAAAILIAERQLSSAGLPDERS